MYSLLNHSVTWKQLLITQSQCDIMRDMNTRS